jgi:hypothetical protein
VANREVFVLEEKHGEDFEARATFVRRDRAENWGARETEHECRVVCYVPEEWVQEAERDIEALQKVHDAELERGKALLLKLNADPSFFGTDAVRAIGDLMRSADVWANAAALIQAREDKAKKEIAQLRAQLAAACELADQAMVEVSRG